MVGEVPLASWQGVTGKNGGEYHYGFTATKILAWPKLPPNHGLNMAPSKEEFASVALKAMQLQKAVGPDYEFLLGGNLDLLKPDDPF